MRYKRLVAKNADPGEVDLIVHLKRDEDMHQVLQEILEREFIRTNKTFHGYIEAFKERKDGRLQSFTYTVSKGKLRRVYGLPDDRHDKTGK